MKDRILFIVFNGEIKFLQNSDMDHREWYQILGGNPEEYDNVIRGYITEGKIIYFKANLNYDNEVIEFATKTGLKIKQQLNRPDLKVCCGINPGHDGTKWEPILVLNDTDLEGYQTEEEILAEQKKEEQKQAIAALKEDSLDPLLQFKNDLEDPKFIRTATTFTIIILGIALISKVIMIHNKTFMISNRWNFLLMIAQMGSFILTIIGYRKKLSKAKYLGILASVASIFMFDFIDIIIGITYIFFTMDYTPFIKLLSSFKALSKKILSKEKKN